MEDKRRIFIVSIVLLITILAFYFIKTGVENNNIKEKYNIYVVYSPTCPHCENLLNFLDKEGIGVEKIPIEKFYVMKVYKNLSDYFSGVPFVFAKVNDTIIIITGYPSKDQERDGYFLGRDFEEDLCIKTKGTPVYINNTYSFCKSSENVLSGNKYSILWLVEQCREYGCGKLE